MRARITVPGIVAMTAMACSTSSGYRPQAAVADGGSRDVTLTMTTTTPASQETQTCQCVKLPKTGSGEILVTGHKWSWTPGTHHIQIYRTTPDLPSNVDLTNPFDCFAPGASKYTSAAAILTEERPAQRYLTNTENSYIINICFISTISTVTI